MFHDLRLRAFGGTVRGKIERQLSPSRIVIKYWIRVEDDNLIEVSDYEVIRTDKYHGRDVDVIYPGWFRKPRLFGHRFENYKYLRRHNGKT